MRVLQKYTHINKGIFLIVVNAAIILAIITNSLKLVPSTIGSLFNLPTKVGPIRRESQATMYVPATVKRIVV